MERFDSRNKLWIGDWLVDPALDEVRRGEQVVKLEPRKMQLLLALARRPDELVTTDELLSDVWRDVVVTQSSLYTSVAQLRRILADGSDGAAFIATIPRKGYRLVAPVRPFTGTLPVPGAEAAVPASPAATEAPGAEASPLQAPRPTMAVRLWRSRGMPVAMATAALTVLLGLLVRQVWLDRQAARADLAVAVLPFVDLSPGGVEQPTADGLAGEVVSALSRNRRVRVPAFGSSLQVRGARDDLAALGKQLAVTHVLDGELFRDRDRVRLTVRLRRVSDADVVWREALQLPLSELSTLPARVAQGALRALRAPDVPPGSPLASAEAYDLYLLGRHHFQKLTPEGVKRAREYYQRSTDLDATFALGYVALAQTWIAEYQFGSSLTIRNMDGRAAPLLERALRLQPELPEALATLGFLKTQLIQYDEARPLLQRALELQPQSSANHLWLGVTDGDDGFPLRALESYARAAQLDPLRFIIPVRAGLESIKAGRYEDAVRHYARAEELAPDHPNPRWGAGILGFARGQLDAAVRGYRRALEAESRREDLWTQLGWIYLDLGMPEEAEPAFQQALAVAGSTAQPKAAMARVHLARGDLEGLRHYLDALRFPPPGVRDVEIDTALLEVVLGDLPRARAALTPGVEGMLTDPLPLYGPWGVFLGHHALIDVAAVYAALGEPSRARPFLDEAQTLVDRYQQQGNVWHALSYHQARIAALRDNAGAALSSLEKAVELGWRRGWWLRLDPALASVRDEPRFVALLERIDRETAEQRTRLAAPR